MVGQIRLFILTTVNSIAQVLVYPDNCKQHCTGTCRAEPLSVLSVPQNVDWKKLQETPTRTDVNVISFTNANIINYFLVHTAIDECLLVI